MATIDLGRSTVVQAVANRLTVNVTTFAVNPVVTVLNTVAITTQANTRLHIYSTSSVHSNGPAVPVMFGLRIDGGAIVQNTTVNVTGAIDTAAIDTEQPTAGFIGAGAHTVELVFRKFNQPAVLIACRVGTLPTLFQSNLIVQEIIP